MSPFFVRRLVALYAKCGLFQVFWHKSRGESYALQGMGEFHVYTRLRLRYTFCQGGGCVPAGRGTRKAERLKNGKEESR